MKFFLTLISVILTILSVHGQAGNKPALSKKEKEQIDSIFKSFNASTPGYGIGISINGHTVYARGYGSANLDYGIPITPQSSFDLASVSKQFTAAGIMLLVLKGNLSLETPAMKFIPELSKYIDTIRVKHLVYNTSGIIDYYRLPRVNGESWITFNYFDVDECIERSLAVDTLSFIPGSKWDYCNVNFMLLAKIVEKASGMAFSEYLRKELFQPLGMSNTLVNDDITNIIKNRVTPYNLRTDENIQSYRESGIDLNSTGKYIQHPRTSPHYGGSGIVSTVNDLLRWSENMVTKNFGGEKFYELMHHTPTWDHKRNNQAAGLYFGEYRNRKTIAWDGGDWGISSQLIRFPQKNLAIVVLSNIGSGEAYKKANQIADVLINNGQL